MSGKQLQLNTQILEMLRALQRLRTDAKWLARQYKNKLNGKEKEG